MNKKTLIILNIVVILMLLWAIADNPYVYYQILKWVVTGVLAYSVYYYFEWEVKVWGWVLAILALLYNPIVPFFFERETWIVIDVITVVLIGIGLFVAKPTQDHNKS